MPTPDFFKMSYEEILNPKFKTSSIESSNTLSESANMGDDTPQTQTKEFSFGDLFKDAFKDGQSTMSSLGAIGSVASGVGSVYDAVMKNKYQKKMLDFAKQDRDLAKANSDKATTAVSNAFKNVFK